MKVTALHQTLKDISLDSDVLNVAVVMAPHVQVASAHTDCHMMDTTMIALVYVGMVVHAGGLFVATAVYMSTVALMMIAVVHKAFLPSLAFL